MSHTKEKLIKSCLTCTYFNFMKHFKGQSFCPDYPKEMSILNADIIGGYMCDKYNQIEVKTYIIPNEELDLYPINIRIVDAFYFNNNEFDLFKKLIDKVKQYDLKFKKENNKKRKK